MFDWLQKRHGEPAAASQERDTTPPAEAQSGVHPALRATNYQRPNGGSGGDGGDRPANQPPQTMEDILSAQRSSDPVDPEKTLIAPGRLLQKATGSRLDSTKVGDASVGAGRLDAAQQAQQPPLPLVRSSGPRSAPAQQTPVASTPPSGAQLATPGMPAVAPNFSIPARQGLSIPAPRPGSIPFSNDNVNPNNKISHFSVRANGSMLAQPRVSPPQALPGQVAPRDPGENGVDPRIRQLVLSILSQPQVVASLPERMVQALGLLISPRPTQADVDEGMAALQAFDVMVQITQAEALVEGMPRPLKLWYHTPNWYASRMWLTQHHREFPRNSIEIFAEASRQAQASGYEMAAGVLKRHEQLLIEATRTGIDSAYSSIIGDEAFTPSEPTQSQGGASLDEDAIGHYFDLLLAWLETPDWGTSRQYLHTHPELLSDAGEAVLEQMYQIETKDRPVIEEHQILLRASRQQGIDQAYAQRGRGVSAPQSSAGSAAGGLTPALQRLLTTLIEWIQTPDWESSRNFLRVHVELLSHDTEALLAALFDGQETDGARQVIVDHLWLIRAAQQAGIDAAYNGLLTMLNERQQADRQGAPGRGGHSPAQL